MCGYLMSDIFPQVYNLLNEFVLSESKVRKVMELFREEMRLGLMANPPRKSVFYMCNTFVTDIPDGTEEGDFLAMDLGGTNLRIHLARLKPGSEPHFTSKSYEIEEKYRTDSPETVSIKPNKSLNNCLNKHGNSCSDFWPNVWRSSLKGFLTSTEIGYRLDSLFPSDTNRKLSIRE